MQLYWLSEKNSDGWYAEIRGLPLDLGHDLWAFAKSEREAKRRVMEKLSAWLTAISAFVVAHRAGEKNREVPLV